MKENLQAEFAKKLVRLVRDLSIKSCDQIIKPNANYEMSSRWKEAAKTGDISKILETIIPDCIDETVFYLLHAIDQGDIHLIYKSDSGAETDLNNNGQGELAGWYMNPEGWRKQYSMERVNTDDSDVNLEDLGL